MKAGMNPAVLGGKTKRPAATWQTGVLVKFGKMTGSVEFRLPNAADGTEAFLEFVDAALGVNKLGEASEERMGIGGDADRDEAVFHAVDNFLFLGSLGRAADETLAGGHINEDDRIVFRMKVLFHENLRSNRVSDAAGRGEWLNMPSCQASIDRDFIPSRKS